MSGLYLVTEAPSEIVCPPWCEVTPHDHRAELAKTYTQGRDCYHSRKLPAGGRPNGVELLSSSAPDWDEHDVVELGVFGDSLTLEDAEDLARAILAAVELARSGWCSSTPRWMTCRR